MTRLGKRFAYLLADDSGQDLVEYAFVLALIALASIVIMRSLATNLANTFSTVSTTLTGRV